MHHCPTSNRSPDGASSGGFSGETRFVGIRLDYMPEDVEQLAGSFRIRHTLAEMGTRRLWQLLQTKP
ncbi:hypothetical protein [Teichococcus globiformis]